MNGPHRNTIACDDPRCDAWANVEVAVSTWDLRFEGAQLDLCPEHTSSEALYCGLCERSGPFGRGLSEAHDLAVNAGWRPAQRDGELHCCNECREAVGGI